MLQGSTSKRKMSLTVDTIALFLGTKSPFSRATKTFTYLLRHRRLRGRCPRTLVQCHHLASRAWHFLKAASDQQKWARLPFPHTALSPPAQPKEASRTIVSDSPPVRSLMSRLQDARRLCELWTTKKPPCPFQHAITWQRFTMRSSTHTFQMTASVTQIVASPNRPVSAVLESTPRVRASRGHLARPAP